MAENLSSFSFNSFYRNRRHLYLLLRKCLHYGVIDDHQYQAYRQTFRLTFDWSLDGEIPNDKLPALNTLRTTLFSHKLIGFKILEEIDDELSQ